ncbi:MAG: hypothetical protein ISS74_03610 [Planctomycetes bacterium]|nr:hypothetical protein [Planctomycetota bacterium]
MANEEKAAIQGIGLVLNFVDVTVTLPVEVLPGCIFRRATDGEVESFKRFFLCHGDRGRRAITMLQSDPPQSYGQNWQPLDRRQWRYWVIETTRGNGLMEVGMASHLTHVELRCDRFFINLPTPERMEAAGQLSGNPLCVFSLFGLPQPLRLDKAVLEDIRQTGESLAKLDTERHKPIRATIEMNYSLADMGFFDQGSGEVRLFVLGLFGVIESLITHSPKAGHDSLTHQIKTKMNLLNRRFDEPLDYSCFDDGPPDTLWSRLYSYRSAIAHGGQADFGGKHQVLKDERTVTTFLRYTAKALLRYALREPDLVLDLRAC